MGQRLRYGVTSATLEVSLCRINIARDFSYVYTSTTRNSLNLTEKICMYVVRANSLFHDMQEYLANILERVFYLN